MLRHMVFWKINEHEDAAGRLEIFETFKKKTYDLKLMIPETRDITVAMNTVGGDHYDICIDGNFTCKEALDTYINHPEHLKVRAYIDTKTCAKTIFDYEV